MGLFDLIRFRCETRPGETQKDALQRTFESRSAVYHKSCVDNYNKQHFERAKNPKIKREKKGESSTESASECKRARRSPVDSKRFCSKEDDLANLCAGGTLHATDNRVNSQHNEEFSNRLWDKAVKLNDLRIVGILSAGTVAAREIWYHKQCLVGYNNSYIKVVNEEEKKKTNNPQHAFQEEHHFRKLTVYINERQKLKIISNILLTLIMRLYLLRSSFKSYVLFLLMDAIQGKKDLATLLKPSQT